MQAQRVDLQLVCFSCCLTCWLLQLVDCKTHMGVGVLLGFKMHVPSFRSSQPAGHWTDLYFKMHLIIVALHFARLFPELK